LKRWVRNYLIIQLISLASDGSVATFDYEIFLTKDSTTNLTATNFHLNNTDPKFEECVASASTSDTAFTYVYQCSQHEIQEFLRTGTVRITGISPNPTRGDLVLAVSSPMKQPATLRIFDLLGKEVCTREVVLNAGRTTVTVSTTELSRSRYGIRLETAGGTVRGAFVKE
jgi:hypothetical protein